MRLCRKYLNYGLIFALLLLMICHAVPDAYATEGTESAVQEDEKTEEPAADDDSDELSELEEQRKKTLDEIDDLKDSIGEVQAEIEALQAEKSSNQSYINQLDQQMSALTSEIAAFEKKIEEKLTDIEETKAALEEAKAACDKQYEQMKLRIQFIYETPGTSMFEVLLSAENITDFLNRANEVASMSDYDRQMMEKLVETKEEIALQEETLEAELEELEMMQAELETQKKAVDASINSKKGELAAKISEIGDVSAEQGDYEEQLEEQEKLLSDIEDQIAKAASPDVYEGSATGFIWPCPAYTRISSYFGPRKQPVPGASTNHKGVDLAAPYGANILASAAGVVTTAKYSSSAGNYVVIAHGNGTSTVYMHASSLLVSVGDVVSQGQVIAKVGSTGYSSGNHLHFGVIKNGTYVDPLGYI